jgi:hypothetical protein
MGKAVTANSVFASRRTGVGIERVAIVTLLARLNDAVTAAIHNAAMLNSTNMVRIFYAKGATIFSRRARRLATLGLVLPTSKQRIKSD